MTEAPKDGEPLLGLSLIVLKPKTPGILNQSASFKGVVGSTCEIPLTAYRSVLFIFVSELAKTIVLTTFMVP